MASQGGVGGGERSQIQGLSRQGSLCNLTLLNEVQNQLGQPLHSMNLEHLLKGLDASQQLDIQRQWSMPQSLRDKTVDQVWRDIQQGHTNAQDQMARQLTFGEMTLEDFLAKAGLVPKGLENVGADGITGQGPRYGQGSHWLMIDATYRESQMSMSDPKTPSRKRGAFSDLGDKVVERRRKRMIKNRESAARSRARKQAYTNELENKVSHLEEENERLKKQSELDKILCAPPAEPKYQLRRTSSASF